MERSAAAGLYCLRQAIPTLYWFAVYLDDAVPRAKSGDEGRHILSHFSDNRQESWNTDHKDHYHEHWGKKHVSQRAGQHNRKACGKPLGRKRARLEVLE